MRVLLHGDYGARTGFGRVTRALGEGLIARGHEVHALAVNWNGWPVEWDSGIKPWFTDPYHQTDPFGIKVVRSILEKIKPDVYCCINDLPIARDCMIQAQGYARALYFPVDGDTLPQYWLSPVRAAGAAATYTEWGREQVLKADATLTNVRVIPHGVDTTLFYPVSATSPVKVMAPSVDREVVATSRDQLRALYGMNGYRVVLWADRNNIRKNGALLPRVAARLVRKYSNLRLWFHCQPRDEGGDLAVWLENYRLATFAQFTGTSGANGGVSDAVLNALYNAADVRVSTSLGEGFGLHTLEAAAAGCYQILPYNSCFLEVGGPANRLYNSKVKYPTGRGINLSMPDEDGLYRALDDVLYGDNHTLRAAQAESRISGPEHAARLSWEARIPEIEQLLLDAVEAHRRPRIVR